MNWDEKERRDEQYLNEQQDAYRRIQQLKWDLQEDASRRDQERRERMRLVYEELNKLV